MSEPRRERDALGELDLPAGTRHGIHTARALANFPLLGRPVHPALARAFGPGARAYPDFESLRDDPAGLGSIQGGARVLVKGSLYWRCARVVDWLLERLAP